MVFSTKKVIEFLNSKIHSLITLFLYLILIGVLIQSWTNLMEESTTFDETFVDNEVKFPSFTLCPQDMASKKSIESFEDVAEEIGSVKMNFNITYIEHQPFEEPKYGHEAYNQTLNNDWYFAPKTISYPPYETVICLIMSPYRNNKHNPDKSTNVSCSNCEICSSKLYQSHLASSYHFSTLP